MVSSPSAVSTRPVGDDRHCSGGRDLVGQRLENVSLVRAAAMPQENGYGPTRPFRFIDVEQLTESVINGAQPPHD